MVKTSQESSHATLNVSNKTRNIISIVRRAAGRDCNVNAFNWSMSVVARQFSRPDRLRGP